MAQSAAQRLKSLRSIPASPPIDEVGLTWAERAKAAWRAGNVDRARDCARKAVDAHDAFGSKDIAEPQAVAACRKLLGRYEKREEQLTL